jgi:hypothetical protein
MYCNCHRIYLPQEHYFRGAVAAFDGETCHQMEDEPLTGNQTIRRGYQSEAYIDGGGTEKDAKFPSKEHGVKKVSSLYQLSYWRVSLLNYSPFIVLFHFNTSNLTHSWLLHIFVSHKRCGNDILSLMQYSCML